ncbi:MAG TPA: phage tail protein, partial [Longimicrobium sp.]|nr:phage tail protein [Longimicrobium sp.]
MDANGTRFHLALGRDDWFPQESTCPGEESPPGPPCAEWDGDSSTVGLHRLPVTFPPRRAERPPVDEDRRGAGRDRFGNWYWIADDGRGIVARSPRDARPVPFWPHDAAEPAPPPPAEGDFAPAAPPPPAPPPRLQGLAVTSEHYLVAGMRDEAALLVWDLAAGGPPVALRWPQGVPLEAWDICAAPDGGAWVLDRRHTRLWGLDRLFRVREPRPSPAVPHVPDFTPADPDAADDGRPVLREGPITLDASIDVSRVRGPAAVEVLCDGSLLVLGHDGIAPVLHRFTLDGGWSFDLPLAPELYRYPEVLRELPYGHEIAFVPAEGCGRDAMEGRLYVVAPDGNQSFSFTFSGPVDELRVELDRRFYPMRRYGGRALVAAGGEAHYDSGEKWVSLLEYPRPQFAREARLRLPVPREDPASPGARRLEAFDGREPGCVWHRLFLDACIPPESSVTVESRAADDPAELEAAAWRTEPAPYLRGDGAELPYTRTYPPGPEGQAGTWELLFQNAVGRWLQLRITLRGNGRITPRVRALRAYYPRFSYLREYLPAVYREDAGSAWFLDRFLSNVEGAFTAVEDRIAAAQVLFDPDTVPPEFLEWLAGWMGAALDASWTEAKKRVFLVHAMEMFAGRGTREGLVRALRLALEECVDPQLFGGNGGTAAATPPAAASAYASASTTLSTSSASTSTAVVKPGGCGCGCGGAGGGGGGSAGAGGYGGRFTVRVVEQFLTRDLPGVAYGDVGSLSGPGTTTTALAWTPAQGPEPLHERWRAWLATRYTDVDALKRAWGIAPVPSAGTAAAVLAAAPGTAAMVAAAPGTGLATAFPLQLPAAAPGVAVQL